MNILMSGVSRPWLDAAFLLCLFWIILVRPERIRSMLMFRIACLLFAFSLIAPVLVNLYLMENARTPGLTRPPPTGTNVRMYLTLIAPAALIGGILLAIESVLPWQQPTPPHQKL